MLSRIIKVAAFFYAVTAANAQRMTGRAQVNPHDYSSLAAVDCRGLSGPDRGILLNTDDFSLCLAKKLIESATEPAHYRLDYHSHIESVEVVKQAGLSKAVQQQLMHEGVSQLFGAVTPESPTTSDAPRP